RPAHPVGGGGGALALLPAKWRPVAAPPPEAAGAHLDKSLVAYARRHRRRLRGHQSMAVDFAKARPFNPVERLVFSAAARDESVARHMHLFAQRLIGPLRFLNPVALAKASAVNIRHRRAAVPPADRSHTDS
ncbi:NAD(P)/FAD-dependent oxidoreductase, partial [Streptomyces sp. NPDC059761]